MIDRSARLPLVLSALSLAVSCATLFVSLAQRTPPPTTVEATPLGAEARFGGTGRESRHWHADAGETLVAVSQRWAEGTPFTVDARTAKAYRMGSAVDVDATIVGALGKATAVAFDDDLGKPSVTFDGRSKTITIEDTPSAP